MALAQPVAIKGEFLFGSMRSFNRDTLQFLLDARPYGDFVLFKFGPFPVYVANHPDVIHEVLVTKNASFAKSSITKRVLYPAVGEGLFTNDGDSWKRQRKLAQPAFHTKRIASYADVMVAYAERLIKQWRNGATVDIEREMSAVTMQIVAKTLFDAEVTGEDELSTAVRTVLRISDDRFKRLLPTPLWLPIQENRDLKESVQTLDVIIQQFIDERRASGEDKGDLLTMLMAAMDDEDGTGMSDKQLRDESMTVFGAGHETTSTALTWTFYLLSQYPEVEAKLHDELARVLGGRTPTFADLPNLPYTEMIVKESMRLYPPAWGTTREVIEPVTISDYPIGKRGTVFVNIYGVQRDERFFPQPELFNPERFSAENEKHINKYAYLPFGAGPRICIGNAFAMMEARLILATIAQQFKLGLAPGQVVAPERVFTLRPKYGMKMVAETREPVKVH
jgi:cytochrome P450